MGGEAGSREKEQTFAGGAAGVDGPADICPGPNHCCSSSARASFGPRSFFRISRSPGFSRRFGCSSAFGIGGFFGLRCSFGRGFRFGPRPSSGPGRMDGRSGHHPGSSQPADECPGPSSPRLESGGQFGASWKYFFRGELSGQSGDIGGRHRHVPGECWGWSPVWPKSLDSFWGSGSFATLGQFLCTAQWECVLSTGWQWGFCWLDWREPGRRGSGPFRPAQHICPLGRCPTWRTLWGCCSFPGIALCRQWGVVCSAQNRAASLFGYVEQPAVVYHPGSVWESGCRVRPQHQPTPTPVGPLCFSRGTTYPHRSFATPLWRCGRPGTPENRPTAPGPLAVRISLDAR